MAADMPPPAGLGERGARMWADSVAVWELTPGHRVLLEEACRSADRLELLDRLIQRFADGLGAGAGESGEESEGSGGITGLLAEARAQQTVLKGMLSELRQGLRGPGGAGQSGGAGATGPAAGGSVVTNLAARIESRRRQAPG